MSWKTLKNYYVYTYLDQDKVPYYVGMGCKNRVVQKHLYVNVPVFEQIVIEDDLSQQEAWNREIELIALYGREDLGKGPLKNLTNGGPTQKSGWKQSKEAREKISLGNKGKTRTLEQKQKLQKKKTVEHSMNIKQAVKNLWNDPEYKESRLKIIQSKDFAHKGKPWSPARREAHMKKQQSKGMTL